MATVKVFISHSSADTWAAKRIAEDVQRLGAEAFVDAKDLGTGDEFHQTIQDRLTDCTDLLVLLSPAAVASHWVLVELGGAIALKKQLVPIRLGLDVNQIPAPITKHLARDINDIEKYYEEIRQRLAGHAVPCTPYALGAASRPVSVKGVRGIAVGDLVRLPRAPRPEVFRDDGTRIGWVADMDAYCGRLAKVEVVDADGSVHVDVDGRRYWWAVEWLEKVERDFDR